VRVATRVKILVVRFPYNDPSGEAARQKARDEEEVVLWEAAVWVVPVEEVVVVPVVVAEAVEAEVECWEATVSVVPVAEEEKASMALVAAAVRPRLHATAGRQSHQVIRGPPVMFLARESPAAAKEAACRGQLQSR
jgi:hypothetical protein